jgi:hypothetical protein
MAEALGDVATKLLFENERVKIWEMRLAPARRAPLHKHERDHILVQIDGDRMAVVPHPTTKSPYSEYLEADVVPGNTSTFRAAASRWRATSGSNPTTSS